MFSRLLQEHPGLIIGVAIGLVLGIIYLIVDFWRTIMFCIFIMVGIFIGKRFDANDSIKDVIEEILPDKFFK